MLPIFFTPTIFYSKILKKFPNNNLRPDHIMYYTRYVLGVFCDNENGGTGNYHRMIMSGFEAMEKMGIEFDEKRMHDVQWIWNETMAQGILDYFKNNSPEYFYKMVVIAGAGHCLFNKGILSSVTARNPGLKQITIIPVEYSEIEKYGFERDKSGRITFKDKQEKPADIALFYRYPAKNRREK